ncbi:MAG: ATP-dependent helicase [Ilumatobacteraceae bacterium]
MASDDLLRGLDPAQRTAVTTAAAPLAVVAAAGSGKTTVLTRRIAYRVADGTALPRHVLALTFTRDAASELKRRLRRLDLRDPIDAGTFHSVALRLLRDRALGRNEQPPTVANDRLRLVRECLTQLQLRVDAHQAAADMDWARARMVDPARYEAACRADRRRSGVPAARYAELVQAYEQLKQRRGVLDFDDLLTRTLHAMRTDESWAEAVRWRYRHLFVDEAQDLNPLQHAVLEAFRDGRPDLCLVGDPRQAIYGWNGADHTTMSHVEERYPGVTVVALTTNYRCTPQVVKAAAAALVASGQSDDSASDLPPGHAVAVQEYEDEHAEAVAVARQLRDLLHHRSGRQLAVLARTNEQITLLQRVIAEHGIATERSAGRSPLEIAIADAARCMNREQLAAWVDRVFADGSDPVRTRVAEEADRFLSSGDTGSFRAWIDLRNAFDDMDDGLGDDAVSLLTFHSAKGREWWGVFVCGAEDQLIPHSSASTAAQLAEEARLFYVALTRAEHRLVITRAVSRSNRSTEPSRWLPAVEATLLGDEPAPPPAADWRRGAPPDPLAPFREWRTAVARVSGQSDKAVCSDRTLRSLMDDPPADTADLARRLGITESAAARLRPLPGRAAVG